MSFDPNSAIDGNVARVPVPLALGCDTGLARFGWALARILPVGFAPLAMGVIVTEKSDARLRVLAACDNFRRAREVSSELERVVGVAEREHGGRVRVVCYEALSLPRNAGTAAQIGMGFGVLAAWADGVGVPALEVSPQALKKAATGARDASKRAVAEAVAYRMGVQFSYEEKAKTATPSSPLFAKRSMHDLRQLAAGDREHGWDAMGAILACADSDVVRGLRPAA